MLRRLGTVAVALAALAACSSPAEPVPTPSPSALATAAPAGLACPDLVQGGTVVAFGAPGEHNLAGVVMGDGPAGVILAHQSNGSVCQWLPFAKTLAERGLRAFAFDMNGGASSAYSGATVAQDVATATAYLRGQGVTSVVLVGASMGGAAVISAAAAITPPVDGVVSVSGAPTWTGIDPLAAAGKLAVPALFLCAKGDAAFADAATAFDAAVPKGVDHKLVIVDDVGHGVALVDPAGGNAQIRAELLAFITKHARK
ncbi:pimeloyl-ACP methyl ester carboxylesterase [Allocatelliglobosispora scoriae]|uniref:Pimeloyl-ACP methyl ester carboxylesterase n=1 Tax=Allocatelliglobosispora scoriae TaxID=643052 RepID=A0A841C4G0_9ACTN|nr:alpha/beta fold hydrolase [Allocatelliglobosispora scoriae]MBB5873942.1 pimeloyl-ACP methyl ester carboxylesterase [Allocatelliglobosispora scoriae]